MMKVTPTPMTIIKNKIQKSVDALCCLLAIEHPRFYLLHPLGFHFLLFKPR